MPKNPLGTYFTLDISTPKLLQPLRPHLRAKVSRSWARSAPSQISTCPRSRMVTPFSSRIFIRSLRDPIEICSCGVGRRRRPDCWRFATRASQRCDETTERKGRAKGRHRAPHSRRSVASRWADGVKHARAKKRGDQPAVANVVKRKQRALPVHNCQRADAPALPLELRWPRAAASDSVGFRAVQQAPATSAKQE